MITPAARIARSIILAALLLLLYYLLPTESPAAVLKSLGWRDIESVNCVCGVRDQGPNFTIRAPGHFAGL